MEPSMSADMGLIEDKQLIGSCHGFLTKNNNARNICGKYIKNGTHFFDILSRYDDLCTYILRREGGKTASAVKMSIPFLKSFGVSDLDAYRFSKSDIELLDGARETINYAYNTLPTFISTASLEHHVMALCEETGFPIMNVGCAHSSLDNLEMTKEEMRRLKKIADRISAVNLSDVKYIDGEATMLDEYDTDVMGTLDGIFLDEIPKMDFYNDYTKFESVGVNEKAYALLEIRKKTEIELSSTIYVGGDSSDGQALDLVRDSSGLSISFNGDENAVRGCNVAVLSKDTTVVSVLASEFYDGGIESVLTLIDDWTPAKLKKRKVSEDHPLRTLLKKFPKKLPVVKKVDRHNVDEMAEKSETFRRKLVC